MSFSRKTIHHSPTLLVFDEIPKAGISRVFSPFHLRKSKNRSLNQNYSRSFCSISTDNSVSSAEKTESNREESLSPKEFLKVMAMVWVGSQVTKLVRAGGILCGLSRALALAPFVDRGLTWFTDKFKFKSQGKAFVVIVGFCLGLALMLFFAVTLLSA